MNISYEQFLETIKNDMIENGHLILSTDKEVLAKEINEVFSMKEFSDAVKFYKDQFSNIEDFIYGMRLGSMLMAPLAAKTFAGYVLNMEGVNSIGTA